MHFVLPTSIELSDDSSTYSRNHKDSCNYGIHLSSAHLESARCYSNRRLVGGHADLSSPMSRTGWCVLNEILVKPAFAWIFCLLTGSLLLAAKSKTCRQSAP